MGAAGFFGAAEDAACGIAGDRVATGESCIWIQGLENGGIVPVRAGNWLVPSLHGDRQRSYAVGQLFDIISNGINTMPSYRSQIPTEDRWAIAAYVRTLQLSHATTIETVPADVAKTQQWAK